MNTPTTIQIDETILPLKCRKSKRAKRLSLRLLEKERVVELVVPWRCSMREGLAFLEQRKPWIANHLHLFKPKQAFTEGNQIPVFGEVVELVHVSKAKRGVWREGAQLCVSGFLEHMPRRVEDYLKKQMHRYCAELAAQYAEELDVERQFKRVSIRNTSSRWGSCSRRGTLSFCWRLVFAPQSVLDYVIAHEVAHFREMNHSARFWMQVARLMPEYESHRAWLKQHGTSLWDYGGV